MQSERKIAFITGSGRRLGRQIAYAFAEQGYDIILHANESVDAMSEAADRIGQMGRKAVSLTGDLSQTVDIRRMAKEIEETTNRLDVLIQNAGVFPERAFSEVDPEVWDHTFAVNVRSQFFLAQELAPLLIRSKGCIINIASAGAYEVWLKHIPYNISKAAAVKLTQALAKQLAPDVRVNAIAPGIIVIPDEEERTHVSLDKIPLKRYGTPRDIADAALYLAEKAAYLTGHVLPVDGGVVDAT